MFFLSPGHLRDCSVYILGVLWLASTFAMGCSTNTDSDSKTTSGSGVEGEQPLENGLPPHREPLSDDADLLGYCLYSLAGGFPAKSEMERLCGLAGDWEGDCRHAWVAGRMKDEENYETTELLEICGDNSDCSFEVLDFRPHPDLKEQLERCRRYAGTHHADCAGHAAQRWWGTSLQPTKSPRWVHSTRTFTQTKSVGGSASAYSAPALEPARAFIPIAPSIANPPSKPFRPN